jgi:HlyD family secretion protein
MKRTSVEIRSIHKSVVVLMTETITNASDFLTMIKKILYILLFLLILGMFAGTTAYLYQKSQPEPVVFQTGSPEMGDIEKTTVASGTIVPRKEIEIKPQISGVLNEILVEPGEQVQAGDVVARLRIMPKLVELNEAENRLVKARIFYADAKQELERQEHRYRQQLIAESELKRSQVQLKTATADLEAAQNNLKILKEGVAKQESAENNTLITSTVDGMVLEVPVKEGDTVVETNTFNAGTTIAMIADMSALVFEGTIDESEVGKLHEGMELQLTIGAIEGKTFTALLEYISPKGEQEREGAVQFKIKAAVQQEEGIVIRAGYSANAKIVLDKREKVLTLQESMILYDKEQKPYVEIEVAEQQFERRDLELGLSDGVKVEILAGLTLDDKVKQPFAQPGEK